MALDRNEGLAPKTARLILPDGREEDVALDRVRVGDAQRSRARLTHADRGAIAGAKKDLAEALRLDPTLAPPPAQ